MPHVFLKSKRELRKQLRNNEISRDNHLLLKKLMKIDHSSSISTQNIMRN